MTDEHDQDPVRSREQFGGVTGERLQLNVYQPPTAA